jgi:hypothetical protein
MSSTATSLTGGGSGIVGRGSDTGLNSILGSSSSIRNDFIAFAPRVAGKNPWRNDIMAAGCDQGRRDLPME